MNYSELISITVIAQNKKPNFGNECNNCGWCCLTEVCAIGEELSGSNSLPCKYMQTRGEAHYCGLASIDELKGRLAIGDGCDAKTQIEIIEGLKA